VHVADALIHQSRNDIDMVIDPECLELVGGETQLDRMRALAMGAAA
jgi:hypothetical protein